ncbi:MAG: YitT family protein [Oliverpabstia sp.]|nr:YitT family protein [Lachnospiraceae bacterium]MDY5025982.1 YitT family protein [Oliverpabstia sp.]
MWNKKSWIMDYLLIFVGTALMSIALNSAFDMNGLVDGGFSGIAIIVKSLTESWFGVGIPLWLTNIVLNIPMFFLGIKIKGIRFLAKTIWGTFSLSFWLYAMPIFPIVKGDLFLAVIFGGVLQGVGIGLVFLGKGTTGGTDMVAVLIQHYVKHMSVARIMQLVDALIVAAGAFVFGPKNALYAIVAIYIVAKVTDGLLEGMNYAKAVYVISDHADELSKELMSELDRGATGIPVKGMYKGKNRMMLFCIIGKKQIVRLKEIVVKTDPGAFLIVMDAREVLGEGFIENYTS